MTSGAGNPRNHTQVVRRQFGAQAARFDQYFSRLASQDVVAWISSNLELEPHFSVLDVATGTGLLARSFAPQVHRVVGLDATPEMLQEGARLTEVDGIQNVVFEEGDAERLPYRDNSFDLVACRIGMHYFQRPQSAAQEMARVCRTGGQVAIIDITSVDDPEVAATHNRLERLRDPSHTRALTAGELKGIAEECGLEVVRTSAADVELNVERWMDLTGTGPEERRVIRQAMDQELNGGTATGMRPFRRDGEVLFSHSWVILVGRKNSAGGNRPHGNERG